MRVRLSELYIQILQMDKNILILQTYNLVIFLLSFMLANGVDEIDAVNMADSERVILDQDKEQEHKEKFTRLQAQE